MPNQMADIINLSGSIAPEGGSAMDFISAKGSVKGSTAEGGPESMEIAAEMNGGVNPNKNAWFSSGSTWKDYLHFCGPGWFVAIAYLDPGNTQADIQAGAQAGYSQLWTFLWVTVLSIYVQVMCARLAMVGQTTLSESMRAIIGQKWLRYVAWIIAEFSVIITDLPEVIGIGIAFNVFFGWQYYVGVLLSPLTTLCFLGTQNIKVKCYHLRIIVFLSLFFCFCKYY